MTTVKSDTYSKSSLHVSISGSPDGTQVFYGLHGRVGGVNAATGKCDWMKRVAKLKNSETVLALCCGTVDGPIKTGEMDASLMFVYTGGVVMALHAQLHRIVWERDLFYSNDLQHEQGSMVYLSLIHI
eukprot:TRINITY_DN28111_c0_g1_i6.p2 TRINITY_DN28111_c0_g1~~TRINITY_DN28111_c0_g1_i6.p2  ORF type:complete len:128 (-),score=26.09 TRINITY_DN28111_c0_g1_i6:138-521(-)